MRRVMAVLSSLYPPALSNIVYKAMLQCDNCLLLVAFFSDVWYLGTGRADGDLV